MARKLHDLAARVTALVKDKDNYLTSPNDEEAAVTAAAFSLSKWKPLLRVKEYSGDGSTYNLDAPSFWAPGFSRVIDIRTPWVELSQSPARPLPESDYLVYLDTDNVEKIKLLATIPATGETCRVLYTAPHVIDNTSSTLTSIEDEERVIAAAAAICLHQMAAIANANANAGFGTDSKDHTTRATQYTALAEFYSKRSGLSDGLAVSVITLPREDSQGRRWLTHR